MRHATNIENDGGCPECDYFEKKVTRMNTQIASLESQLKERDDQYNKLWELFEKQTESKSLKDQEIERLKGDHYKSLVFISDQWLKLDELREALREVLDYAVATGHGINDELEYRCRKLIGVGISRET